MTNRRSGGADERKQGQYDSFSESGRQQEQQENQAGKQRGSAGEGSLSRDNQQDQGEERASPGQQGGMASGPQRTTSPHQGGAMGGQGGGGQQRQGGGSGMQQGGGTGAAQTGSMNSPGDADESGSMGSTRRDDAPSKGSRR